MNLKSSLLSQIQNLVNEQVAILGSAENAIAAEYSNLLSSLESIVPTDEIQASLYVSTKYFIETLAHNYSTVSENELLNVANSCYANNGYGTLMARSLSNLKIFMPENCEGEAKGSGIQSIAQIENKLNPDSKIAVYPSYFTNEVFWRL